MEYGIRPNKTVANNKAPLSLSLCAVFFHVYRFCLVLYLMVMDGLQVIESLDSLWFFSNIFCSSTTQPLASDHVEGNPTDQNHAKESPRSEPPKPMTPILENQQNQSPNAEIMVQRCPKCGDLAAEIEAQIVEPVTMEEEVVESPKPPEKEERRRRRRRSKRSMKPSLYQRGRILGELDLGHEDMGFDVNKNNVYGSWMVEETCGYGRFFASQNQVKMPPLTDGMAMKEHLKSWAYAVACTVR